MVTSSSVVSVVRAKKNGWPRASREGHFVKGLTEGNTSLSPSSSTLLFSCQVPSSRVEESQSMTSKSSSRGNNGRRRGREHRYDEITQEDCEAQEEVDDDVRDMVRAAAVFADMVFDIEEDVVEDGIAKPEDLRKAEWYLNKLIKNREDYEKSLG